MPKSILTDNKPKKRSVGAPKKEITASVTLRFRVTPEQEIRFKEAAKKKKTNFTQWAIAILEESA